MPYLGHLTPLARALLKVPCAVEDLTAREAQALYDRGYITSPRVGWLWATRKGVRMQLEIAASIPAPKGRGGLGGLGSGKPICWPYPLYRYPDNAEWVPVETLWNLREYDRAFTRPAEVARVMESLATFGWTSPATITYYQHDRTALLGEGNHRVGAAVRLGMKWGLAVVYRHMKYPGPRHYTSRQPAPVRGVDPDRHGYVKADLKPSDIGLPARPLSVVDLVLDGKRIPGVPDDGGSGEGT